MMKITAFLFFFGLGNLIAGPSFSQNTKVSLDMKDATVESVLNKIEEISEFYFLFNHKLIDVNRKVDIQAEEEPIKDILSEIFPSDVRFIVSDRQIVLTPNQASPTLGELMLQQVVTGTVTDKQTGNAMPGVNIIVKGSSLGVITNVEGKYSISISDRNAILVFSFIGYISQEIPLNGRTIIDIALEGGVTGLEEVVVVGYGTMKRRDLTGSVTQVKVKEEYIQLPNVSIAQTLQGTISGLNVGMVEKAGQNPSISVRGVNTLSTSDESPLIVVDGAIYRGSLIDINSSDIESINILKDASSAAIYGSQSSNGVVLITTKKSFISGKPIITYTNQTTLQVPARKLVPMNGEELSQFILDCHWERGSRIAPDYLQANPDYDFTPYLFTSEIRANYTAGIENDWYGMFTSNGHIITHNIDIKGKNQGLGYFISGGINDTRGFVTNDKYKRYNLRINLDSKINDWLNVGVETFLTSSDYSGVEPDYTTIFMTQPWAPIYDDLGNYVKMPSGAEENPFLTIQQEDEDKRLNIFGNMHADIKLPFLEGFNYRINYSQNYITSNRNNFNPQGASYTGTAYKNTSQQYVWSLDNIVTYVKSFKDIHNINLTLVYGVDDLNISSTNSSAQKFLNPELGYNSLESGDPTLFSLSSGAAKETSLYTMARLLYDFRSKYLITGTIRRDGFSGFGSKSKIGLFPSVALAWVISEENFLKLNWVDYLKLRASYGASGRRGVSRYDTQAVVSSNPTIIFGDGGKTTMGQWISKMANNDLGWETTTGLNTGIDFNLINSRLNGNIEFYLNNTKNILYTIQLPLITGFSGIMTNIGKVRNHGIELTLTGNLLRSQDVNWDISFNYSRNRNKIVSILGPNKEGVEEDLVANNLFIGEPQAVIYDYEIVGEGQMWQLSDKVAGVIPAGFAPGTYKIVDQNKDEKFSASNDKKILGYPDPAYRFGIANNLSYKNISLYFFINSIQGGKNYYKAYGGPPWNWNNYEFITHKNGPKGGFDYWMPENPNAKYRRLDWNPSYEGRVYDQRNFIRLQDVTISYTFKKSLINKLSINNLRIFASGKNLFTITKWEGWDPETGRGIDAGYPVMTDLTLGLNVEF